MGQTAGSVPHGNALAELVLSAVSAVRSMEHPRAVAEISSRAEERSEWILGRFRRRQTAPPGPPVLLHMAPVKEKAAENRHYGHLWAAGALCSMTNSDSEYGLACLETPESLGRALRVWEDRAVRAAEFAGPRASHLWDSVADWAESTAKVMSDVRARMLSATALGDLGREFADSLESAREIVRLSRFSPSRMSASFARLGPCGFRLPPATGILQKTGLANRMIDVHDAPAVVSDMVELLCRLSDRADGAISRVQASTGAGPAVPPEVVRWNASNLAGTADDAAAMAAMCRECQRSLVRRSQPLRDVLTWGLRPPSMPIR